MTLTETETDPRSSSRTNRWVVTRDQFAAAEQRYATPADSGLVAQERADLLRERPDDTS